MKSIKYIMIVGMAIMAISCAKLVEPTQIDLAVGLWETTDVFVNRDNFTYDFMSRMELERNGAYLMVEGDDRASTGTWEINAEGTSLTLSDANGESIVFTIASLTSNRMHIRRTINTSIAGEIEIIYRMEKVEGPGLGGGVY